MILRHQLMIGLGMISTIAMLCLWSIYADAQSSELSHQLSPQYLAGQPPHQQKSSGAGQFIDHFYDNITIASQALNRALTASAFGFFGVLASLQLVTGVVYRDILQGGENIIVSTLRWALSTYLAWIFVNLCFGSYHIPGIGNQTLYTYIYQTITDVVTRGIFTDAHSFFDRQVIRGNTFYFGYPYHVAQQIADQIYLQLGKLSVIHVASKLILFLIYIAILVMGLYLSALFLFTSVQFYLQGVIVAYFTFFIACTATRDYGTKIISYTIGVTAKTIVLIVIISIGLSIISVEANSITGESLISSSIAIALIMLMVTYFAERLPTQVESMFSGYIGDSGLGGTLKTMTNTIRQAGGMTYALSKSAVTQFSQARNLADNHRSHSGTRMPLNRSKHLSQDVTDRAVAGLNQQAQLKRNFNSAVDMCVSRDNNINPSADRFLAAQSIRNQPQPLLLSPGNQLPSSKPAGTSKPTRHLYE